MNWFSKMAGTEDFPESLNDFVAVKRLGGTTPVYLLRDSKSGKQYVAKLGAHAEQAETEYQINRFLAALGVPVPNAKLYPSGKGPIYVAEFVNGVSLWEYVQRFPEKADAVISLLRQHFSPHALAGNWDVIGLDYDNVLVDEQGQPHYIDLGGSGPWRAQGLSKGKRWNDKVDELRTLRAKNLDIYEGVTDDDIRAQISQMQPLMQNALSQVNNAQLRDMLSRRFDRMSRY